MGNQDKKLGEEIRKYRIVIHNLDSDDKTVRSIVRDELGDKVEVMDWDAEGCVNYECPITGSPQRVIVVKLRYKEI